MASAAHTTFDSTKESLTDMLGTIASAKTQLPDFQRGWVWDDEHIRSVLASVAVSYPIGAVMMLQSGGAAQFRPKTVEGVVGVSGVVPERLILDGQQRLTSLYQALYSGRPVETRDARGKPIRRWYYLDVAKALSPNGDREDAILSVPEDRRLVNFRGQVLADYSSREREAASEVLPLDLVFDFQRLNEWMMCYVQLQPERTAERLARWSQLSQDVISNFQQYQLPLIVLRKETPKEAVCQVFEKVNTGGVSLTVFELLTATFAADDFQLRQDWENRRGRLARDRVLYSIENTDFLQAIALLATHQRRQSAIAGGVRADAAPGVSCKRKDILGLTRQEYLAIAPTIEDGYQRAARLLFSQKIFAARDLPYRTQLTPLAAVLGTLGQRGENVGTREKILRWYWCGVFGELYGGATESRFARDLPEVLAWLDGGPEPSTVGEAVFARNRLVTVRTRNSAAYKGLAALLLRDGGEDLLSGQPIDVARFFDDKIDVHHIFPQRWCRENGIEPQRCDSIVNKTPLSARTNRIIGGRAPSKYLLTLQKQGDVEGIAMDAIVRTHVVLPETLRADDFGAFFEARAQSLIDRIQQATGKTAEELAGDVDSVPEDYETSEDDDETPQELAHLEQHVKMLEAVLDDFCLVRGGVSSRFERLLADFSEVVAARE